MQNSDRGGRHAAHDESRYRESDWQAPPYPHVHAGHVPAQNVPPAGGWHEPATPGAGVATAALMGRVLHGAGALLSVALIAGLAVWGYKLAMRDVTGVPVVRALEGPMRIQPENPGGEAAAHQGLAVNSVAAEGQAEPPAAQVALAPAPVALTDEDLPARETAEVSAVPEAEAGDAPLAEAIEEQVAAASLLVDEQTEEEDVASALALANALSAGVAPLSGEEADLALTPEAEAVLAAAIVPVSVPGVARSPRPPQRPDDIVARAAASPVELALASAAAAAPQSVREVDAAELPAGTRLVQLGAFDSVEVARAEWEKLATRFPEMLEGKDRVIEMAQSGGKTFYRLRAMGFGDLPDARGFCAALAAGQAACIPVVTR